MTEDFRIRNEFSLKRRVPSLSLLSGVEGELDVRETSGVSPIRGEITSCYNITA